MQPEAKSHFISYTYPEQNKIEEKTMSKQSKKTELTRDQDEIEESTIEEDVDTENQIPLRRTSSTSQINKNLNANQNVSEQEIPPSTASVVDEQDKFEKGRAKYRKEMAKKWKESKIPKSPDEDPLLEKKQESHTQCTNTR